MSFPSKIITMPEGPTIILMKEDLQQFKGKKVIAAHGSIISDKKAVVNKILKDIKTFGKLTFLIFEDFSFRIHLLMFGSYSLQEKPEVKSLRLSLQFDNGTMYFYTCSAKIIENKELDTIDWETDIMSDIWNSEKAVEKMRALPKMMICDALMNQDLFSGVGNIIKNEALFRAKVHPECKIQAIPDKVLHQVIKETQGYSFDFLKWKRKNELKKHFQIYHQEKCPLCGKSISKKETGKSKRTSFYCEKDQKLY